MGDEDGVATSNTVTGEDEENADWGISNSCKEKVQNWISGQLKKNGLANIKS